MEVRIKNVMASVFGIDISQIDEKASSDVIENWDSMNHMNLIIALEDEFGIRFNEEDIPHMTNYKIIRNIIETEVGK